MKILKNFQFNSFFVYYIYVNFLLTKINCYVYMCWYVSWSETREELPFSADLINFELCSHVIYSAALVDPNSLDIIFLKKNFKQNMNRILNSKSKNENLKVILTIGSYDTKNYGFEAITNPNNSQAMETFSKNLINFLRQYNFDGVLIDYEFPNMINRGFQPHTKHGFSMLLQTIKEKFIEESILTGNKELLLLAVLAARLDWIDNSYETEYIINYLDYLLLLTFDLKSSSENKTRITSALFPLIRETGFESTMNIASSVAKWITEGAPPEKIVIGVPAYGRSYELLDPLESNEAGAFINGPGAPGPITGEKGVLSYFEICEKISQNNSVKLWQPENLGPYLVYEDKYWIGYEDQESIYQKMLFIKANNLSGAFLWTIDLDDFTGQYCGQGVFPLLNAIRSELTQPTETYDFYDSNYSSSLNKHKISLKAQTIIITIITFTFICFFF